jgi:hypothetical protein
MEHSTAKHRDGWNGGREKKVANTKAAALGGGRGLTGREKKILALVPWPWEQRAAGLQDLTRESEIDLRCSRACLRTRGLEKLKESNFSCYHVSIL